LATAPGGVKMARGAFKNHQRLKCDGSPDAIAVSHYFDSLRGKRANLTFTNK